MSTLVVVYDEGSVAPTRIGEVARDLGCDLVFVLPDSPHNRELHEIVAMIGPIVPAPDGPDADLVARLRTMRPDGVMTFSEFRIGFAAQLADALGLPGVAPSDVVGLVVKDTQRRLLAEAGVDSVVNHVVRGPSDVDAAAAATGFPAVLKPLVGASSRNALLVESVAELRAAMADIACADEGGELAEDAMILEEFLVGRDVEQPWGDYLAIDCVADGNDVRPLFLSGRFSFAPPFRERGGYSGAGAVPEAERKAAAELACQATRALRLRHGVSHVEIKLTDAGPRVIELNGRLGGWVDDLATRCGAADPAAAAMRIALGGTLDSAPVFIPRDPERIAFHYLILPPFDAVRVASVHDVAALRRIGPVRRVIVQKTPGDPVGWQLGTRSSVAALLGATASLDELADTVAAAESADWIGYHPR